jgi:CBS domain-containing protein
MLLRDVMTRGIKEIPANATIVEAAERMRSLDVGALPVCQNDKLVGVITDRDIAIRTVADGRDPKATAVSDAMSKSVVYCYEDDSVESAAKLMEEKQIRRLPVFDRNNRAVGIVSLGDLAVRNHDDRLSGEVLERISEPSQPHA